MLSESHCERRIWPPFARTDSAGQTAAGALWVQNDTLA
jgi:hypothetical protein